MTTRILRRATGPGVAALLVLPAAALAGGSGGSGGAYASAAASIDSVACRVGCADLSAARAGSTVRISGSHMEAVDSVTFLGAAGPADDVEATPAKVKPSWVEVKVPARAMAGPLRVHNVDGAPSPVSRPLDIDRGPTKVAAPGTAPAVQIKVNGKRRFQGAKGGAASLSYLVTQQPGASVVIQLVRPGDGTVAAQWNPGAVAAGTVQTVAWDGKDVATGDTASEGRYEFRVYTTPATAADVAAASAPPTQPAPPAAGSTPAPSPAAAPASASTTRQDPNAAPGGSAEPAAATAAPAAVPTAAAPFLLADHIFPVRAKHTYGEGAAAFGATRGGHTHQGQDVMAACGTPLVAARGGVVKFRGSQSLAGNYLVIDEDGTGVDAVYMHLRRRAIPAKGEPVFTGQAIGEVGRTGDASVCHLHFELWSAPGWYDGGSPFDPLPSLKAWDAIS